MQHGRNVWGRSLSQRRLCPAFYSLIPIASHAPLAAHSAKLSRNESTSCWLPSPTASQAGCSWGTGEARQYSCCSCA